MSTTASTYTAPVLSFTSLPCIADLAARASEALESDGVLVITDLHSPETCAALRANILTSFAALSPSLVADPQDPNLIESWDETRLPVQSRRGMYQCLMSGAPPVEQVRNDKRLAEFWSHLHEALGHTEADGSKVELVLSHDGINIAPPIAEELKKPAPDWPHTDAIYGTAANASVQGQVVLNGSQAVLRCTPRSHLFWDYTCESIMSSQDRERAKAGWHKLTKEKQDALQKEMTASLGNEFVWQTPIYAPEGSLVLWYSSTLHSATGHATVEPSSAAIEGSSIPDVHPLRDWRFVIYVCHFPLYLHDGIEGGRAGIIKLAANAVATNRSTAHSSIKLFPKVGRKYTGKRKINYSPQIMAMMKTPRRALKKWSKTTFLPTDIETD